MWKKRKLDKKAWEGKRCCFRLDYQRTMSKGVFEQRLRGRTDPVAMGGKRLRGWDQAKFTCLSLWWCLQAMGMGEGMAAGVRMVMEKTLFVDTDGRGDAILLHTCSDQSSLLFQASIVFGFGFRLEKHWRFISTNICTEILMMEKHMTVEQWLRAQKGNNCFCYLGLARAWPQLLDVC